MPAAANDQFRPATCRALCRVLLRRSPAPPPRAVRRSIRRAVAPRHLRVVRALVATRHAGGAAEQRRDLVKIAERPMTAAVVELV